MVISPNKLTIDLGSLVHNLRQIKSCTERGTKIMGIVKSDAYGHGLIPVSKTLVKNGVDHLGVAFVKEALELRREGIEKPIIILCGTETDEDMEAAVENALTPVIFDLPSAEKLENIAASKGRKINVHIKIDTGMGRLGVSFNEAADFLKSVLKLKHLEIEGLMSHLSSADEEDTAFTKGQIDKFKAAVSEAERLGMNLKLNHLANSAGIAAYKDSHFDMVRPGIMLYGGLPCPGFKTDLKLKPVMSLTARVLQIRNFEDNTPVSYSRTYYTKGARKIAIVSAGYADGIPRNLSNRGRILINGCPADITGNVCMNMFACDVTEIPDVKINDECVVLGNQMGATITGDDIAELCGTISYEIFLSMGLSLERVYVK